MSPAVPRPGSRRSWLLLGVLVAGYMGVYLCRKNLSVAVPLLRAECHSTKEQVGRVASAGTLAYALGKMFLCPLVDRWGGRRGFLLSLTAVALFGLLGAFAPSLAALAVIYALNRLGAAAGWASMIKQIPPWFGPKKPGLCPRGAQPELCVRRRGRRGAGRPGGRMERSKLARDPRRAGVRAVRRPRQLRLAPAA